MIAVTVDETSESLQRALGLVLDLCREGGYSAARSEEISTAIQEALSNARRHGNAGDPSRPINVRARTEAGSLLVEVHDQGSGPARIPPLPDLPRKLRGGDRPSGWGLFLIRSLASEVAFISRPPRGHTLRMRFGPEAPAAPVEPQRLEEPDVP